MPAGSGSPPITGDPVTAAAALRHGLVNEVGRLVSAHGTGSFATVSPLKQIWRDVNVGARHAVLTPSVGRDLYGKNLLGLEDMVTPLYRTRLC